MLCNRAGKTAGPEYLDLAFRGSNFVPLDCTSWLLDMEEDIPLNIFSVSNVLLPILNSRETPFKKALDWLQFSYTADRLGGYVAPASTVLAQYAIAEGGGLFPAILSHLRILYP